MFLLGTFPVLRSSDQFSRGTKNRVWETANFCNRERKRTNADLEDRIRKRRLPNVSPLGLHQLNKIRGEGVFHWWSPGGETFGNLRFLILSSKPAFVLFRSLLLSQIKKSYGFSRFNWQLSVQICTENQCNQASLMVFFANFMTEFCSTAVTMRPVWNLTFVIDQEVNAILALHSCFLKVHQFWDLHSLFHFKGFNNHFLSFFLTHPSAFLIFARVLLQMNYLTQSIFHLNRRQAGRVVL